MSNFGKKYDPNKRAYNKSKREHTVDLLKMQRDSNKKSKTRKVTKNRSRNNSISWGLILLGVIFALIFKK